eukprot:COSAG04_NODE_425_length_14588_cov_5.253089_6_plen_2166_part_01
MGAWTTTVSGQYSLSVQVAGTHISGSPFPVDVQAGDFDSGSCTLFFVESLVGETQRASVALKDVFGNIRRAAHLVDSGENVDIEIAVVTAMDAADVYWALAPVGSNNPQLEMVAGVEPYTYADNTVQTMTVAVPAARYELVALSAAAQEPFGWHGASIRMLVAGDVVLDAVLDDFGTSTVLPVIVGLDAQLHFHLCSPTAFGNHSVCDRDTALQVEAAAGAVGHLDSIPSDGSMLFSAMSTLSGRFFVSAVVNDADIDCNGSVSFDPGPTSAAASTVRAKDALIAGKPSVLLLEARDQFGNARGQDGDSARAALRFDCAGDCAAESIDSNFTDGVADDGVYEMDIHVTLSGSYSVEVWLNDAMPRFYAVNVEPAALDFASSAIDGVGWSTAEAGVPAKFTIQTRDRFGNNCSAARLSEHWTCPAPCRSAAGLCDQHCIPEHGGLFGMGVTLLSRLRPEREATIQHEVLCPYSVRYLPAVEGLFEASYTCTISGLYNATFWDAGGSDMDFLTGTIRVKATVADGARSVVHDLDAFQAEAGRTQSFEVQLVDRFGNQRLQGLDGQDLAVDFAMRSALPSFYGERPDLVPQEQEVTDDGSGVVLVAFTLHPADSYDVTVALGGNHVVGNRTHTVVASAACTGTAGEISSACLGAGSSAAACPAGCTWQVAKSPFLLTTYRGPAPMLERASLHTSGFRIEAEFDMLTNMPHDSGCQRLLPPDLRSSFGSACRCVWATARILVVTLEPGAPFFEQPRDTLGTFRMAAEIQSEHENTLVAASSIAIEPAGVPAPPVAVIRGPRVVGSCDDVLLRSESYGRGYESLTQTWRVWKSACVRTANAPEGAVSCALEHHVAAGTPGLAADTSWSGGDDSISFDSPDLTVEGRYIVELNVQSETGGSTVAAWDFVVLNESVPALAVPRETPVSDVSRSLVVEIEPVMSSSCIPDGAHVIYRWQRAPGAGTDIPRLLNPEAKDLSLLAGTLNATRQYSFLLFAWYSTAPQRSAVAIVSVQPTALAALSASSPPSSGSVPISASQPTAKINAGLQLALMADVPAGSTARWFVTQGALNLSEPFVTTTGRTQSNLVLAPRTLTPGQQYRFRLVVSSAAQAYGEITALVNFPPVHGDFAISPSVGWALATHFEFGAAGWVDEDMPLLFSFSYEKHGEEFLLCRLSSSPKRLVQLPPGDRTDSGWIAPLDVKATIADQYYAESYATRSVIVQSPVGAIGDAGGFGSGQTATQVVESYLEHVARVAALGESLQLVHMLSLAAHQLNADEARRRRLGTGALQQKQQLRARILDLALSRSLPKDQHARRASLSLVYFLVAKPCELSFETARRSLHWAETEMTGLDSFEMDDFARVARICSFVSTAASDECVGTGAQEFNASTCVNSYRCGEGRCSLEVPHESALERRQSCCAGGQCSTIVCQDGFCEPGAAECAEGRCITGADGRRHCIEGHCPAAAQRFVGTHCNVTAEEAETARLEAAHKQACMLENVAAILQAAAVRFASLKHVGESAVVIPTDAFVVSASMQQVQSFNGYQQVLFGSVGDEWTIATHDPLPGAIGFVGVEWRNQADANATSFASEILGNSPVEILPPRSALPKCLMPCFDSPPENPTQLDCLQLRELTDGCSADLSLVPWLSSSIPDPTLLSDKCPVTCGTCSAQAHQLRAEEAAACFARKTSEAITLTCHSWDFATRQWEDGLCQAVQSDNRVVCSCRSLPTGPVVVRSQWSQHLVVTNTSDRPRPHARAYTYESPGRGSLIPLATMVLCWVLSLLLWCIARVADARARHQIYMEDEMKRRFEVSVRPRRSGECRACASECSHFVRRHHLFCPAGAADGAQRRLLLRVCLVFGALAAVATTLALADVLRWVGWQEFAASVDGFLSAESRSQAAVILRRASLASAFVCPADILSRAIIGRLHHTEQQAARAPFGRGGRPWHAPTVHVDSAAVTAAQANARRFIIQNRLRQAPSRNESTNSRSVRLEWATSGISTGRFHGPCRYTAQSKVVVFSEPDMASEPNGNMQEGDEFDVQDIREMKHTRWFRTDLGWVRETAAGGRPLCVPVRPDRTCRDADLELVHSDDSGRSLALLRGISSFYRGESVAASPARDRKLLPPLAAHGSAAVAKWEERRRQRHAPGRAQLSAVRDMYASDASRRALDTLMKSCAAEMD